MVPTELHLWKLTKAEMTERLFKRKAPATLLKRRGTFVCFEFPCHVHIVQRDLQQKRSASNAAAKGPPTIH